MGAHPQGMTARRISAAAIVCVLLVVIFTVAPAPTEARANVACDVGTGPIGVVTGAAGIGNPVGDACNEVSGAVEAAAGGVGGAITSPVTGALKGLGNDVFRQLTGWVAEGASWLMGKVVTAIDTSTTPNLDTEGFIRSYGRMAAIAAVMACAMFLLAILEGIAQGSPGLLVRVLLVNVPLAFLGTSLAFSVVQLLLGVTDGLSAAVTNASHHDSTRFFETAIGDLGKVGGEAGRQIGGAGGASPTQAPGAQATGAVAVPLFVGFLAATVGAFAAFFVWLELWMRDAAVYVVALFMPLALAASIWPRWTGALRKTGEILIALIGSKFVIVAIVSLSASLVAEDDGSVEHVLAAAALMCLACFAPFVLLRLVPFSEGALAAAYGRRSAAGGAASAVQMGTNVQMLRNMGRSGGGSGVSLWGADKGGGSGGGGSSGGGPGPSRPGGGGKGDGGGEGPGGSGAAARRVGGAGGTAAAARGAAQGPAAVAAGPAATAAVPAAAASGAGEAAGRLSSTAAAQGAGAPSPAGGTEAGDAGGTHGRAREGTSAETARPRPDQPPQTGAKETGGSSQTPQTGEQEEGGSSSGRVERPPRPSPEPPQRQDDDPGDRR